MIQRERLSKLGTFSLEKSETYQPIRSRGLLKKRKECVLSIRNLFLISDLNIPSIFRSDLLSQIRFIQIRFIISVALCATEIINSEALELTARGVVKSQNKSGKYLCKAIFLKIILHREKIAPSKTVYDCSLLAALKLAPVHCIVQCHAVTACKTQITSLQHLMNSLLFK